MNLETLNCNSCAAPLEVAASAEFVTCRHCSTQLAIRRTGSAVFTEELEQLAGQVRDLIREGKIADLDRCWDRNKQHYLVTERDGSKSEPSEARSIVWTVLTTAWILVGTAIAVSAGATEFLVLGLPGAVICVFVGLDGYLKAKNYRAAYRRYLQRRAQIDFGLGNRAARGVPS
ncbi:MAG: hypothetical protein CMJ48_08675 [Planctomycetaceae bacterium]|nr:hypothetical protein [Planctomycetaceae bacterium]